MTTYINIKIATENKSISVLEYILNSQYKSGSVDAMRLRMIGDEELVKEYWEWKNKIDALPENQNNRATFRLERIIGEVHRRVKENYLSEHGIIFEDLTQKMRKEIFQRIRCFIAHTHIQGTANDATAGRASSRVHDYKTMVVGHLKANHQNKSISIQSLYSLPPNLKAEGREFLRKHLKGKIQCENIIKEVFRKPRATKHRW